MNRSSTLYLVLIFTLIFAISCSGGSGNVTAPGSADRDVVSDAQNYGTLCTGLWQVVADKATGNVDVVQLRSADKILNVLGFMEPPVLVNMDLDWEDLDIDFENNTIDVGVILSHPIPDDVFSGFDVRGVCFGPEVTNADGLTILTGPEYFSGEPFGYMDGLLGAPNSFGQYEGLAGYKYFCEDLDEDEVLSDFFTDPANYANRGMFPAGGVIQRNYNLDWNGSGYDILVFNYAIYANYDWPIGEEPWDVDDWSITAANSAEAFCCSITETANSLWWSGGVGGGAISLDVEIWDWQGDITDVTIESVEAGIIAQTSYDTAYPGSGAVSTYMYDFLAVSGDPTSIGDLDILITVTDSKTFGECWFLDMLSTGNSMYDELIYNCFIHTANVIECPVPTVESTDPAFGAGNVGTVTFTCTNLIDGPSLGVKFTDGTTDWVGTSATYVSGTEMTADMDLTGATLGDTLDIVITNGCATEGTGPATWDVLYNIIVSGTPNITIVTTNAKDITCDPTADRVGISYSQNSPNWRRYTNNYGTVANYSRWGRPMSNFDSAQNNHLFFGIDYMSSGGVNYPVWSWTNWTNGSFGGWFTGNMYEKGMKEMANPNGSNYIYAFFDNSASNKYRYFRSNYPNSYSTLYYISAPFYNGSGTTGVVANNLRGMTLDSSGYVYILENDGSGNHGVEKWQMASSPTYQSVSFGSGLEDLKDITTDSNGYIWVLDDTTAGGALWLYDTSGNVIGKSGEIDSSDMSGDPLRMDCFQYSDPDEVHVLHTGGVTKFTY